LTGFYWWSYFSGCPFGHADDLDRSPDSEKQLPALFRIVGVEILIALFSSWVFYMLHGARET